MPRREHRSLTEGINAYVLVTGGATPVITNSTANVTSISDGGVGIYTVNTTAFPSINYVVAPCIKGTADTATAGQIWENGPTARTTTALPIRTSFVAGSGTSTAFDPLNWSVAIIGA